MRETHFRQHGVLLFSPGDSLSAGLEGSSLGHDVRVHKIVCTNETSGGYLGEPCTKTVNELPTTHGPGSHFHGPGIDQ